MVSIDDFLLILLEEAETRTTFRAKFRIATGLLSLHGANPSRTAHVSLVGDVVVIDYNYYDKNMLSGYPAVRRELHRQFLLHTQLDEILTAISDAIFHVNER